jgi:hypothetical protein
MGLALYCSLSARRRGRTNYIHINAQLLKIMVHYSVRLVKIAKESRADHQWLNVLTWLTLPLSSITIRIVRSIKNERKNFKNVYTHLDGACKDHAYSGREKGWISRKKVIHLFMKKKKKSIIISHDREGELKNDMWSFFFYEEFQKFWIVQFKFPTGSAVASSENQEGHHMERILQACL